MRLSTIEQARQVVELLNRRNQLAIKYAPEEVFENKNDFFIIEEGNKVVACGETKKVQWYQWEIRHVSVLEDHEGKGYGSRVVKNLENIIREGGGRIAQCTIRDGNVASETLFISKGFQLTIRFHYSITGNVVGVYRKKPD